ncbi:hypothetical protein DICPUDRAFT_155996 [Dictyostelium purpureum]|uniref:Uncharacterized protein n=1 Tax=Dictyostelium purpureum TaxID=5786 RepID=F0ZVF3_DICPU|nr:uncharacterized protein DICPUDRAFT_155996 [Dictyostelium purpureum]EGC32077.1 hypothetical protein DICPUDRAFT_155996 [Dictyostelium purpureum]|eukprot:XP_003291400.1 hypothetical protein DICPUDRAFT_155996 [Dictyostelium purpureum]
MFLKNNSKLFIILIINSFFIINSLCQDNSYNCPNNSICFFKDVNYSGDVFVWRATHTYRDLPRFLHNHVGSFISNNVEACFKNWVPLKLYNVSRGDNVTDFFNNDGFGNIIDGVSYGSCDK